MSTNKCTAAVILRKDKVNNTTGLAPLAIQFFINGTRKVVALNLYIRPDHWDIQKRKVTTNCADYKDYNLIIDQSLAKANKLFVDYHLMEKELTPAQFMDEYTGAANRNDFIGFMQSELERRLRLDLISKNTYKGQRSTLSKLKQYKRLIMFSDLTPEFIERFDAWHKKHLTAACERLGKKQVLNSINTREKAKSHIRTYINLAINRNNVRIENPFKTIKVKSIKGTRTFLEQNEIVQLHQLFLNGELDYSQKLTLAKFMFACFTSIRISDSQRLHEMKTTNESITFIPEKTKRIGKRVTIHLNETAQLYFNYIKNLDFPNYTDQEMNRALKRITKLAAINKEVTFHVARHTFATQFIANGGDVTVLQQILGHSDIRATMVYVHMAHDIAKKQINLMDNILELV
jgi:site-specific recombinase XerD